MIIGKLLIIALGAGIFSLLIFWITDRSDPKTKKLRFGVLWLAVFFVGVLQILLNPDITW